MARSSSHLPPSIALQRGLPTVILTVKLKRSGKNAFSQILTSAGDDRVGVTGPLTEFAAPRSQSVKPETTVKPAKTRLGLATPAQSSLALGE